MRGTLMGISRLSLCLLCPGITHTEREHIGTVVIIAASPRKIVVGADSRVTSFSPEGKISASAYDKCKIATLNGKVVFAAVGKSGHESQGHPEFTWDSFALARDIAGGNKGASTKEIAAIWGKQVAELQNMDAQRHVVDPRSSEGVVGIFVGFEQGLPTANQALVVKSANGVYRPQFKTTELLEGQIYPSGAKDIAEECAGGQTDRAKGWLAEFMTSHPDATTWDSQMAPVVEYVINLTFNYSKKKEDVGPPIDLIEIDSSGTHWICKKQNCPN